jgi:hypothetical protein
MDLGQLVQAELVEPLIEAVINEGMVATEQLLQSIRYETNITANKDEVKVYAVEYLLELRDGEQYKSPPTLEDIEEWILAKDLEGKLDPYAVLETIQQDGTTWDQQGGSERLKAVLNPENIQRIMNIAIDETINEISQTQWQLR